MHTYGQTCMHTLQCMAAMDESKRNTPRTCSTLFCMTTPLTRSGTSSAIAKLRHVPNVHRVSVDLTPLNTLDADAHTAGKAAVQSAILSNYAFDKYATTPAAAKGMRTLSDIVRA